MRYHRAPTSSVARFHEALHFGKVDVARRLIFQDPSLANARSSSSPHETSLMVAASSSAGVKNSTILIQLLLSKGALLRTKDDHRRQVLMTACASGAASSIVKCLLDWDASSKYQILHWGDQDEDGKTALGLSCLHGHGRLASFILDQLQPQDEVGLNTPLQALFAALESRDERCVVDLLRNRKVRRAVEKNNRRVERLPVHGEWIQVQSQQQDTRSTDREVTVSSCVAMAVELEMVRVVQLMHRLNRQCVGHATWFAIYNALEPRSRRKMVSARRRPQVRVEFRDIADLYRRDCIWERMQLVFLIRYAPERSQKMTKNKGGLPLNIVAEIPDALFRIVVEFLKPEFDDAEEAQKERFKSVLDLSSW